MDSHTRRRDELERLEQTNPMAFHREVEKFAAGSYVLCKDNYEEVIEAMYQAADGRRARDKACDKPRVPFTHHVLNCLLFMAFGAFFMMLWLIEPEEIIDVAGLFWGLSK